MRIPLPLVAVTSLVGVLVVAAPPAATSATTAPTGYTVSKIAGGLTKPTALAISPDGRLFVSEQTGTIRVIKNGKLLTKPFLALKVNSQGSRGLMGVTFDPDFPATPLVYVHYTTSTTPIHNRVSRFTVSGDVASKSSERVLINLDNQAQVGHQGGALHFGPDRRLYVTTGDNDSGAKAQQKSNRFGKVLRINRNGTIPEDNPFVSQTTGANRAIWALGLRNPFAFAFQPGTGRMFINDVGDTKWEEINDGLAGKNYGWPLSEGSTTDPRFESPLFRYGPKTSPGGCAITGGDFYNPATVRFQSQYVGDYFFSDFCSGWISVLDVETKTVKVFAKGSKAPVDLRVSNAGDLYFLTYGSGAKGSGTVGRIRANAS